MLAIGAIVALLSVLLIVLLAPKEEVPSEVASQLPLAEALGKIETAARELEAAISAESGDAIGAQIIPVGAGCPPGMDRMVAHHVAIAGISRRMAPLTEFVAGCEQALILEREPTNPFDRNAIAVIGIWVDGVTGTSRREQLGYVPREAASDVAALTRQLEPLAGALQVMFKPVQGTGMPGVRFDIWTTKYPRTLRSKNVK